MDLVSISSVLTSVKIATDIAKLIKDSTHNLEDAEARLKVAELIGALADVKLKLAEVQDALLEKDREIFELKQQLTKKSQLSYDGRLYWADGDEIPFCAVCHEKDNKSHHLTLSPADHDHDGYWFCKVCKNIFQQFP